MIRIRLDNGTFLLGVDAENVRRLKDGHPLNIDLTLTGGTDRVLLMYGETMADIVREIETATGQKLPPAQPLPTTRTPQ